MLACSTIILTTFAQQSSTANTWIWNPTNEIPAKANFHITSQSDTGVDYHITQDVFLIQTLKYFVKRQVPKLVPGKTIASIKYTADTTDIDLTKLPLSSSLSDYIGQEATPQFEVVLE